MRIVWTNEAAASSLDMTRDDIVGKFCHELWHSKTEPCEDCPVIKAKNTGLPQENEAETPDGRFWFIKGYPILNEAGEVTGIVEVTREITEQRKAALEAREARARAELFNDLMAHDLNNINQGIMASLELMLMQGTLPAQMQEPLSAALEQVRRGVALIANVRKFSKIDREKPVLEPIDIYPPLKVAIETVKNSYPQKEFIIENSIVPNKFKILGDEFLADAFYNILHNSAKHDHKESVKIQIHVHEVKEGSKIEISFDDFGPGIQDNLKMRILTRLSESDGRGSGLGLTLVQRIVQRYNGEVKISDRIDGSIEEGARVIISLPIYN
jgi:signal transduction histidine kinase